MRVKSGVNGWVGGAKDGGGGRVVGAGGEVGRDNMVPRRMRMKLWSDGGFSCQCEA